MGTLSRITQFKDKSSKVNISNGTESIPTGIFAYPALMAADILLYDAEIVPVGKDQKQHLELTQSLARGFNNKYGKTFVVPKPYFAKEGSKIMSLTDPTIKMSKSSKNIKSYISLFDSPKIATKKIMTAVTDSENKIYISDDKPGIVNLLQIYSGFKNMKIEDSAKYFKDKNYKELKEEVAQVVSEFLSTLQASYQENMLRVDAVAKDGALKANKIANQNLKKVFDKIGL
jgi:tryptophanyl-tRNA synthetase